MFCDTQYFIEIKNAGLTPAFRDFAGTVIPPHNLPINGKKLSGLITATLSQGPSMYINSIIHIIDFVNVRDHLVLYKALLCHSKLAA